MSGASSATARSEPIARRCGSEVISPILPILGPARHRKTDGDDPFQRVTGRLGQPICSARATMMPAGPRR